jgi:hypothetical protein
MAKMDSPTEIKAMEMPRLNSIPKLPSQQRPEQPGICRNFPGMVPEQSGMKPEIHARRPTAVVVQLATDGASL